MLGQSLHFSRFLPNRPPLLSGFDIHPRWMPFKPCLVLNSAAKPGLFHGYRDLSTKIIVNKIRTDSARSQSGARTTKFHRKKTIICPIRKANDEISLMMNERTEENFTRRPLHKRLRALKNSRGKVYFCLLGL